MDPKPPDSAYFTYAFIFLRQFRALFDFKLTHFFVEKPYEKVPSSWLSFLSRELERKSQCLQLGDDQNAPEALLKATTASSTSTSFFSSEPLEMNPACSKVPHALVDFTHLFTGEEDMPEDLRSFITDAFRLSIPRSSSVMGKYLFFRGGSHCLS